MRKLVFAVLALISLASPVGVLADEIICPQPYGGGVVCGVHTPVATGLGDNLAIIGGLLLTSSFVFSRISKRSRSSQA
jgi:hypothetical protein